MINTEGSARDAAKYYISLAEAEGESYEIREEMSCRKGMKRVTCSGGGGGPGDIQGYKVSLVKVQSAVNNKSLI